MMAMNHRLNRSHNAYTRPEMRMVNIEISEDFFQRIDETSERQMLEGEIAKLGLEAYAARKRGDFVIEMQLRAKINKLLERRLKMKNYAFNR